MRRYAWAAATLGLVAALCGAAPSAAAPADCDTLAAAGTENVRGGPHYDAGTPDFTDIWLSPHGSDANRGDSREAPLATLEEAWSRIPTGRLTTAYRIRLLPGTYPDQTPYLEDRHGSRAFPIVITSEAGPAGRDETVVDGTVDVADSEFVYLQDLTILPSNSPNDAVHFQHGDHFLLSDVTVSAPGRSSYDLVKVNQVSNMFVEDSDLAGATDNALDFMAVHCGHIIGNDIHQADDWCAYVKGASSDLRVEGNRFFDCSGGGFTAGQGSGFQFAAPPYLHYEAYAVKVVNNVVHDVGKAAFAAQGGYDVLIAYNTAFRAGQGYDHILSADTGERTCDPGDATERKRCDDYHAAGGWGPTSSWSSDQIVHVPNRHVFIYNNLLWNDKAPSDQQLRVPGPRTNPAGYGAPTSAPADDDLRLVGNIIANGDPDEPFATDGGCLPGHPTCDPKTFFGSNIVNSMTPQLIDAAHADFRPKPGGNVAETKAAAIPDFSWSDAPTTPPVPPGDLDNAVIRTFDGTSRGSTPHPGAW